MKNKEIKKITELIIKRDGLRNQLNREIQLESLFKELSAIQVKNKITKSCCEIIGTNSDVDSEMNDFRQAAMRSHTAFLKGNYDKYNLTVGMQEHLGKIDSLMRIRWKFLYDEMSKDLIETLDVMKRIYSNPEKIVQLLDGLNDKSKMWPMTKATKKEIDDHLRKGRVIIESLDVSPSIKEFLNKISSKSATVLDLTDEVLDWIKSHKLVNSIILSFRNY